MDNLTHSLTGVLAGRVLPGGRDEETAKTERTVFWLMLASVNLPDADIITNIFTDP